LVINGVVAIW
jgi:Ca2+-transporting ATPase